jgi:hypothetical protein
MSKLYRRRDDFFIKIQKTTHNKAKNWITKHKNP